MPGIDSVDSRSVSESEAAARRVTAYRIWQFSLDSWRTLNRWGACYPEKKARRKNSLTELSVCGVEGHEFCEVGSRIFHEAWVADFAGFGGKKARATDCYETLGWAVNK